MNWTLEEIASNRPHTKEENLAWFNNPKIKQRPTCSCLYDMEHGLESIFYCALPCKAQEEIGNARDELKNK